MVLMMINVLHMIFERIHSIHVIVFPPITLNTNALFLAQLAVSSSIIYIIELKLFLCD